MSINTTRLSNNINASFFYNIEADPCYYVRYIILGIQWDLMSNEYAVESNFSKEYSLLTRKVVRLLSENSRMSVSEIAKRLNVSRPTVKGRIDRLEKELGMRYTIEVNERAIGLSSPHLIEVKFSKKPDYEKIKSILQRSYIPQVAFSVQGAYDLVIYANAFSGGEYIHWNMAMNVLLSEYGVTWHPSEMAHKHLGFFPLRDEAINRANIDENSKKLLICLNDNARLSFQQISKRLGMHFSTVKYNFDKLVKNGYIKRTTITMDPLKTLSFIAFFDDYTPSPGFEASSAMARKAIMFDEETPLISRYLISGPLIGSHTLFVLSVFDSKASAYKCGLDYHKSMYAKHGVKRALGEVKDVILGRLPIRSVDIKKEYKVINWTTEFNQ
jgi:DNA-binding Lrp family transcriptional regulator